MKKNIVICKVPKSGMGNQLFVIMKAVLFANINNYNIQFTGYHQFKIGPYIRFEKSKRKYLGNFKFEESLFLDIWIAFRFLKIFRKNIINEVDLNYFSKKNQIEIFLISKMPHWSCLFQELKPFRIQIKHNFHNLLSEKILNEIKSDKFPCIGVHIRMGDFKKLAKNEDFSKVGATRTPLSYFINIIKNIREINGRELPVSIFSDGRTEELQEVLSLNNVILIQGNSDIVDLILLSKSKIILTSAGSTFSYWAGFLSEATLIMHPDHIHEIIRDEEINSIFYEGPFSNSELLKNNIVSL